MPCWQILHQAQHNVILSRQTDLILRGLKFIIVSTASWRTRWSTLGDRSWNILYVTKYRVLRINMVCETNNNHQHFSLLIFWWEWGNVKCTSEKWKYERRIHWSTKILVHEEKCPFLMYFWTLNSNMFPEFLYHPHLLRCIRLCDHTHLHMWVTGGL